MFLSIAFLFGVYDESVPRQLGLTELSTLFPLISFQPYGRPGIWEYRPKASAQHRPDTRTRPTQREVPKSEIEVDSLETVEISARAIIQSKYRVCWGPHQTRNNTKTRTEALYTRDVARETRPTAHGR